MSSRREGRGQGRAAIAGLALGALVVSCAGLPGVDPDRYPEAPRGDVVDDYHGVAVADPYRPLEALDAQATREFVAAQNALTRDVLDRLPARDWFAARLRELIDYERFGVPDVQGGVYVYEYNDGRLEQDVLRVTRDPSEPGTVLLDPNALAADGSISLSDYALSPDGRLVAYALSDGGSDWDRWQVRETATGADRSDRIEGTKFGGVAWLPDTSGFFYSRYPAVNGDYDDGQQVRIWFHRLGTPQAEDREVYAVTDHPTRNPYGDVTDDGRYLVIDLFDGYETNGVYYAPLAPDGTIGDVVRLLDGWDARYEFLGNAGSRFFFQTTRDAPLGRVVAIDLERPEPADWIEIVPEAEAAIEAASLAAGQLFVEYVADVRSRVLRFALDGTPLGELPLPGAGTVAGLSGEFDDDELFFSYTDFTTPATVYRYRPADGAPELWAAPEAGVDPERYEARQVFATSRDGTRVPMYIVARRGFEPDGSAPVVLYGYGGFRVSLLPGYSTARMAWLEAGGVYAVANLRGGGEYGDAWHRAGTRLNKQNVFDDFIAAAEWLVENGYTRPERLAIWGGSNGGLLVGAVTAQRPELFGAAVPAVGVLDMLRYQLASANARQWSSDYGLSENPDEFRALYAYSPLHRLEAGTCYPATLVMADANDDRVVPWHSYKYAAALQAAQGCRQPTLLRVETDTGHGAGASTTKIVNEYADQWAFVAAALGFEPAPR